MDMFDGLAGLELMQWPFWIAEGAYMHHEW